MRNGKWEDAASSGTSSDRHGGGQEIESPRLHFKTLLINTPITVDDNIDNNRADTERYAVARMCRV